MNINLSDNAMRIIREALYSHIEKIGKANITDARLWMTSPEKKAQRDKLINARFEEAAEARALIQALT